MDTQLELLKEKWDKILESIRDDNELSNVAFKTWLLPLKVPYLGFSTIFFGSSKKR